MKKYIESGRIKFKERYGANSRGFIFKRYRNNMEIQSEPLNSLLGTANDYMNQAATTEMLSLMGKGYFSYPKPVQFLYKLVQSINKSDAIILDFFSGSATTAHAVMLMNAIKKGNRKYIMIQIPELCDSKSIAHKDGFGRIQSHRGRWSHLGVRPG